MKWELFERASKVVIVVTICFICIKPILIDNYDESFSIKDQRSFSILSITINHSLF